MEPKTGEDLLNAARGYQVACILMGAADLDIFNFLNTGPSSAARVARGLACDERGTRVLLDALVSVGILSKQDEQYALPELLRPFLVDGSPQSTAAMLRHQANCLRRWARLPWVVRSGEPPDLEPSIRGAEADNASFIEAMNVVSSPVAEALIREVNPGGVRCVLDVGGASGTWTLAWLKCEPTARAILFDLPAVIPLAQQRLELEGCEARVQLAAGDFYRDALPAGADLVWLSAIIHQNSREQNRELFRRAAAALPPGGRILIRDIVMDESRTTPLQGALFAINMLVATRGGGTFTLTEIREDLESAGFCEVRLARSDPGMHAVVSARRRPEDELM
jgi:precorrin-6B methylase 2